MSASPGARFSVTREPFEIKDSLTKIAYPPKYISVISLYYECKEMFIKGDYYTSILLLKDAHHTNHDQYCLV